ncbi:6-phosphogluconolactonase [Maritalea porphyrae]|jgi:6-phosphogluconolactonase|uniref:6-phosphogluconolactonase n=1 Tax=Maritalea porphyrae TaxID=880732 RepID=UPI0022B07AE7|nr:6-phosphogluconolactonase [Maritalea porphyrae]MCZ4271755.1 6-phosphogluconolactonase [Maritalea porphyrae]
MTQKASKTDFANKDILAAALAEDVAGALRTAISRDGKASLLVSGGSTPKLFFQHLSRADLDWSKVFVSLVDERWVEPSSDRSNAKLVAENLLQGDAANAHFEPLFVEGKSADAGIEELSSRFTEMAQPITVVILGMGTDGHTASFFPGGDNLSAAIDLNNTPMFSSMRAAGAGEERITFTLPTLLNASLLALHIEGEAKQDVLDAAQGEGDVEDMPIRAVLRQDQTPLNIYWCP